jgi:hypothetical protein
MEYIIIRFYIEHLRVRAHAEYYKTVKSILDKCDLDTLEIRVFYDVFASAFAIELSVLDVIRKSEITIEIHLQDHVRDCTYRGFSDAIDSMLNHYKDENKEAAQKIKVIVGHYGNITTKTLDEETAAIDNLVSVLRIDANMALLNILGLTDWVDQLDKENKKFQELMLLRYKEVSQRPTARLIDARKAVDKAFRNMINQIEALVRVKGVSGYENLIKEINTVSERYKNILAQQAGSRNKGKDDEDDISNNINFD